MGEKSSIEWTDATVNFWWGCTKIGPGCDHCFAEALSSRFDKVSLWGVGAQRRKIKGAVALLHRLNNSHLSWQINYHAAANRAAVGLPAPDIGPRRRVFIQSMSDLFDLDAPLEWFGEAWNAIESCRNLTIQIVTKRISAVEKRLRAAFCEMWPQHVGLLITVVNQQEADRDIPRLLALKAKYGIPWVGVSIEPLLGPVDIGIATGGWLPEEGLRTDGLNWVIVGGESGPAARPMHPAWVRALRDQCAANRVPFFFKQWGEWAEDEDIGHASELAESLELEKKYLYEDEVHLVRVGKKAAGRRLDAVEHNGCPE